MSNYKPAIVVVAFNRAKSLKRLLGSLNRAEYLLKNIPLIISIDKGDNEDTLKIAEDFIWSYGDKQIIYQSENLGLKRHILKCGDLTKQHGSIILLEDDLYVSTQFYDYTVNALNFYADDARVSQISLYKHEVNNATGFRFSPLNDAGDTFFMQFASSWGQAWSYEQWKGFRSWLKDNDLSVTNKDNLSDFVINWKETSWLKYFIKYNVVNNKFCVFPRISLTSNFSDEGTHVSIAVHLYQQPLLIEQKKYNFKTLDNSLSLYDSYYELHELAAKKLFNIDLDFEVDLYGIKKVEKIKKKYLLSVKKCVEPIEGFGMLLKPQEMNVIEKTPGTEISLGLTKNFLPTLNEDVYKKQFKYYWTHNVRYSDLYVVAKHRFKLQFENLKKKLRNGK